MPSTVGLVLLGALVASAVWFDLAQRRIPNWICVGGLLAALVVRAIWQPDTLPWGLLAAGLALGFGFVFYLLGGLGAGDVKFMAAVAAFLEPSGLVVGLLVMGLVGGLMAMVSVVRVGRVRSTFTNLGLFFLTFGKRSFSGWKGESPIVSLTNAGSGVVTNPYAVAIGAGAIAGWFTPLLGWTP
jgi:prepilin peptidase CpaA